MVRISFLVRERVNIRDLAIQFVDKKTPCQFGGCKQVFQTDPRPAISVYRLHHNFTVYPLISPVGNIHFIQFEIQIQVKYITTLHFVLFSIWISLIPRWFSIFFLLVSKHVLSIYTSSEKLAKKLFLILVEFVTKIDLNIYNYIKLNQLKFQYDFLQIICLTAINLCSLS